jgi:rubrerythrin
MDLKTELTERFARRLLATPEGRAHVLSQIADAEANGENQIFEHILAHVHDEQLRKMIEKHQADEIRHEHLFRGCVQRTGINPGPVPAGLKLIDRLDAALGGFFARPIDGPTRVMEAYLLLQVIEERAITQFTVFEKVFREIDPVIADTFAEVARDEERHLKYCHAISRRYAPDEITRQATLNKLRALEAQCFADNSAANMAYTFEQGWFDGGPLVKWLWRTLHSLGRTPYTGYATAAAMLAVMLSASGCTAPNPSSLVTLDQPAVLYAWGPSADSRIEARRQGAIDPVGHVQSVPVTDARFTLDLGEPVKVTRLELTLGDVDLPATPQVPDGLQLRSQRLYIDPAQKVVTEERSFDTVSAHLDGALKYQAALPISTGLYPLGVTDVTGSLRIDVGQDEGGRLRVWLHADPGGTCGEVGDIMTFSQCALDVELTGVNTIAK